MSQMVTGTLVQGFTICKRQTWLMAHQIVPDQEHSYLEIGRLIDEKSYDRARKCIFTMWFWTLLGQKKGI